MHERSEHIGSTRERLTGRRGALARLLPGLRPASAAWRGGVLHDSIVPVVVSALTMPAVAERQARRKQRNAP